MGKKYLIYVDILGYNGKAAEIAKISGFEEDICRENYLRNPLKRKIEDMTTTKFQGISEIEGSDNYVIIVDTVEEVIEIVGEITRINIPHKDFQWIPLEVGVESVAWAVAENFDRLPDDVRNILFTLAEKMKLPGMLHGLWQRILISFLRIQETPYCQNSAKEKMLPKLSKQS